MSNIFRQHVVLIVDLFLYRIIMSGDSPNAHRNEVFDFKEGRSSPIATSSKDIGIQSGSSGGGGGAVTASVLVEPSKETTEHNKEEEHVDLNSTTLNNSSECDDMLSIDAEKTLKLDDSSNSNNSKNNKDEKKNLNGDYDKLDGVWNKNEQKKDDGINYDDDNCIVQCLYYSIQCCDCAIM